MFLSTLNEINEIIGQPYFGMIKGFPNQQKLLLALWQGTRERAENHIPHKGIHRPASSNDLNKSFVQATKGNGGQFFHMTSQSAHMIHVKFLPQLP